MINDVFLDMDGVLVDFVGSALSAFKQQRAIDVNSKQLDIDKFMDAWPPGEWNIPKLLHIDEDEFWDTIHKANDGCWWEQLSSYPWAGELVDAARQIGKVRILSSPSNHPSCYSGKKVHRDRDFGELPLILCREKFLLAMPDRLLIDDNDRNVRRWREHGGLAILFPRIWNANHEWKDSPMEYVNRELEKFREGF